MITDTTIVQTIDTAGDKIRYDEACKRLLSEKIILAWIMKVCLEEYHNLDVWEIATQYIEGMPQIGKSPTDSNITDAPVIHGSGTEDVTVTEQVISYDIRFSAMAPGTGESVGLLINVEAQNDYYPGYPLIKRALYYCSRMISGQYGIVFTRSHYEKIQKVYSIWICMDPPRKRQKTIARYSIREDSLYGRVNENREDYDLLRVIMICLGEPSQESDPSAMPEERLIRLLEILFSVNLAAGDKKRILEKEYGMHMIESIGRLVDDMCNLSDGVEARGIKKGIEQGIRYLVEVCQEFGKSLTDTIETVAMKYGLDEVESREKVEKYWKNNIHKI